MFTSICQLHLISSCSNALTLVMDPESMTPQILHWTGLLCLVDRRTQKLTPFCPVKLRSNAVQSLVQSVFNQNVHGIVPVPV
jgi:hypothetical protein